MSEVVVMPDNQQPAPVLAVSTRVFLSYSRKDTAFTAWLRGQLESHGVEVFRMSMTRCRERSGGRASAS